MSSLNEAFIKAYGRESSTAPAAPAPSAPPAPPASQTLENWYSHSTWYRVEAAAPAPVAPPHVPIEPALYQPPTASELNELWVPAPAASETDYRLTPAEPVPPPELVIDDEYVAEVPVAPPPVAPPAPAVIKAPKTPPATAPAVVPPLVSPDFDRLFAPMQITTGWEQAYTYATPISTAGPVPVVTPTVAKAAPVVTKPEPAKPVVETPKAATVPPAPQPVAASKAAVVDKPVVEAKPTVAEKPVASVIAPRLDAAVAAPIPKPHVAFTPPKAIETPAAAMPAQPVTKPVEPAAKQAPPAPVAPPPVAPLGLVQPAWEVDRFQWPEHCKQLLSTENEYLADVGLRLANAARDGLNILAVTSTRRGEGRTTLALCLARAAAQAGVKVALVDADIENAQLVNELGVEAACGWHEVVLGKQPLAEAAIVSLEDKFAFFPWTDSSGLKSLNDPRATRVLREIAKAYSLVILDLGPVPGRETRLFEDGDACPVDAAILVRDVRWTSAIEAQRVAGQLTAAGVDSVGIAENFGPRAQQAA